MPKPRFLRYGLRTFLAIVTILGGLVGPYMHQVYKQKAAVAWVQSNGGTVGYAFHIREPSWLHACLGVDGVARVTHVDLHDAQVSELSQIANLTSLQSLSLNGASVSDLTPLANLASLESLDLEHTQVSNLSPLTRLDSLKWLHLENSQVVDLSPLVNLSSLKCLYLDNTPVSDLSPLANLPSLVLLYVGGTEVSSQSVETLREACPKLVVRFVRRHTRRFIEAGLRP